MATGKAAFSGKSRASLIAAILTADPAPMTQLQPLMPVALERIVKKCLAKDPDERWQSASDLASELSWIAESTSRGGVERPGPIRTRPRLVGWVALALALVAAGLAAGLFLRTPDEAGPSCCDQHPCWQPPRP